jgi:hypothetical protein
MNRFDSKDNLSKLLTVMLLAGWCGGFAQPAPAVEFIITPARVPIAEGGSTTVAVRLDSDPFAVVSAEPSQVSGTSDLVIPPGQTLVFDSGNFNTDQYIVLDSLPDDDRFNDQAVILMQDFGGTVNPLQFEAEIVDAHAVDLIVTRSNAVHVPEGQVETLSVYLATDPQATVSVLSNINPSMGVQILSGGALSFNSNNYMIPQDIVLRSTFDGDLEHERGQLTLSATGYEPHSVSVHEIDSDGRILHVIQGAPGGGNGLSWATAFNNLQAALNASVYGDQIWIAQGTYTPDGPGGSRFESFRLPQNIAVFGGFAGDEVSLLDRAPENFVTILSGDLNSNDTGWPTSGPPPASWSDNAYHVVMVIGDALTILDGVTVTQGNADSPPNNDTLLNNPLGQGGGIYAPVFGQLTLSNCRVEMNFATTLGAGIFTNHGIHVIDCHLTRNRVDDPTALGFGYGGGLGLYDTGSEDPVRLIGCDIESNQANHGGGAYFTKFGVPLIAAPVISRSTFSFNSADKFGGGLVVNDTDLLCDATLIQQNTAAQSGGGLYMVHAGAGATATIDHSMFLNNIALEGGGMLSQDVSVKLFDTFVADYAGNPAGLFIQGDMTLQQTTFIGDSERRDGPIFLVDHNTIAAGEFSFTGPNSPVSQPTIGGPGSLALAPDGQLTVADGIITSEIQGTGTVYVAPGWRCRLQDGAKVRLDGDPNLPACSGTANAMQWGRILVEGDLHVSGGVVQQSNIEVRNDSTIASCGNGTGGRVILETDATLLCNHIISYDDRHLFIQPGAIGTITLSENDVTIIITPDIDSVENGQGKMLELWAEDIRCPVSDPNTCTTLGFCHLAGLCVDYTNLANARELIVRSNARVNLTNRPGFEVPPLGPETIYVEEVILEPNAVLNIGLQTLYYDTLTIRDANGVTIPGGDPNMNGSSIVNIPQLGFPLEVIRFEDQCEFATRVRRDATNGLIERVSYNGQGAMAMEVFGSGPVIAGSGSFAPVGDATIQVSFDYLWQIVNLGTTSCTPQTDPDALLPLITVYLSDDPVPGVSRVEIAKVHPPQAAALPGGTASTQFATFRVAMSTDALGGLDLSGGAYVELELCGEFSRVLIDNWDPVVDCASITPCDITGDNAVTELDFLTVLSGFGEQIVDSLGNVNYGRECLDQERSGYVDAYDLAAWDLVLNLDGEAIPDSCGFLDNDSLNPPAGLGAAVPALSMSPPSRSGLSGAKQAGIAGMSMSGGNAGGGQVGVAASAPVALLLAGKSSASATIAEQHADYLYEFKLGTGDITTAMTDYPRIKPANGCDGGGHGRLVAPFSDDLYQLHAQAGLIRLRDGLEVVEPGVYTLGSDEVVVGVVLVGGNQTFGLPLADAAFDSSSTLTVAPGSTSVPQYVYVGPVIVVPGSGNCPYYAVLRMEYDDGVVGDLSDDRYLPEQIFGLDPSDDACISVTYPPGDCWKLGLSPDYQRIKEIEHDGQGNLFVISASAFVDDYLMIYETSSINSGYRISNYGIQPIPSIGGSCQSPTPLAVSLPENPTAMFVDPVADVLFLAKGALLGDGLTTEVHLYELVRDGSGHVTSLQAPASLNATVTITQPTPEYCRDMSGNPCAGSCNCDDCGDPACNTISGITAITRDPNGSGATFAAGFSAPLLSGSSALSGSSGLFTSPTLVEFDPSTDSSATAGLLACDNLRLPVSAVLASSAPRMANGADWNGDCAVNAGELELFESCSNGPQVSVSTPCSDYVLDADGDLDMGEIALLQQQASSLP